MGMGCMTSLSCGFQRSLTNRPSFQVKGDNTKLEGYITDFLVKKIKQNTK